MRRTPLILFGKGNAPHLDDLFAQSARTRSAWTGRSTLEDAARRANGRVALQGNLDPAILYGNPDAIRAQVKASAGQLRDRQRRLARGPRLQPRPRHVAGHESRPRRRAGRGRACRQHALISRSDAASVAIASACAQASPGHRLAQETIEARRLRLGFGIAIGTRGHREQRECVALRAQHARQRQAVHARQVEVEQRRIESARGDLGECRQAVARVHDAVALRLQQAD